MRRPAKSSVIRQVSSDSARYGAAGHDVAGAFWQDPARPGPARHGTMWQVRCDSVGPGVVCYDVAGEVWRDQARRGAIWQVRYGEERSGMM
jgi:hypothetical protein